MTKIESKSEDSKISSANNSTINSQSSKSQTVAKRRVKFLSTFIQFFNFNNKKKFHFSDRSNNRF